MPPLPTEYERPLDWEHRNWMRVRFASVRGQILSFVVQYEMDDGISLIPVVRYDSAHGRPHRDMMFQDGRRVKLWLDERLPYNEAFVLAERDIEQNWRRYREAFYRGHL